MTDQPKALSDEELADLEARARSLAAAFPVGMGKKVLRLVAEVRRLRSELVTVQGEKARLMQRMMDAQKGKHSVTD